MKSEAFELKPVTCLGIFVSKENMPEITRIIYSKTPYIICDENEHFITLEHEGRKEYIYFDNFMVVDNGEVYSFSLDRMEDYYEYISPEKLED